MNDKKVIYDAIHRRYIIQNLNERLTATEPYIAWLDPYIWDDKLVWPGKSGGDIDALSLLNSAPTLTIRGDLKHGDRRYEVYHPLMNYEGAEIVLLHYAKHNRKKEYDSDEDVSIHTRSKKGWCVASGSIPTEYFVFNSNTSYDELYDFLDNNGISFNRHFGLGLRIPNPEWTRENTNLKNATYKGISESLWSDVLPIKISGEEGDYYGIGII